MIQSYHFFTQNERRQLPEYQLLHMKIIFEQSLAQQMQPINYDLQQITQMPKKSLKWSVEEDQILRKLKDQQIQNNEVSWQFIANQLSLNFNSNKSAKQCRERYMNYLKFGQNVQVNQKWSQQELDLLLQLYLEKGSSWSKISYQFKNKSENLVKNRFHSSLKRAARVLTSHKLEIGKSPFRQISNQILISSLDLSNQILKLAEANKLTVNFNSQLFKLRFQIVKYSLKNQLFKEEEINQLIELISSTTSRLKCFGLFKIKNRKRWKISEKNILAINQFDKIFDNPVIKIEENNLPYQSMGPNSNMQQDQSGNIRCIQKRTFVDNNWAQQLIELPQLYIELDEEVKKSIRKDLTLEQEAAKILGYYDQKIIKNDSFQHFYF